MMSATKSPNISSSKNNSKTEGKTGKPTHKTHKYRGSLHNLTPVSQFDIFKPTHIKQNAKGVCMEFVKELTPKIQPLQTVTQKYNNIKAVKSPKSISGVKDSICAKSNLQNHSSVKALKHRRNFSHGDQFAMTNFDKEKYFFKENKDRDIATRSLFTFGHVIGRGGFGKVWKVELKRNNKVYALKEMSKALIIAKKSISSVINERKLLGSLKNNFLVNMVQSFQDRETLFLVMDYLPGGDLRYHLGQKSYFRESQAKFIVACIYLGLEYLHGKKIIHRDIKPENIVFDKKGYVRITDLGVAKIYKQKNYQDTSGTPGYMAPEVICGQNHTFSVDHFALGVIAYEMMLSRRPYYGRNRKEVREEIMSRQVQIKKQQIPDNWSMEAADFINRLIQRKQQNRLGFANSAEIREHPWLRQYPWESIIKHQFPAPYIPEFPCLQKDIGSQNPSHRQLILQYEVLLREPQVQNFFKDYDSTRKQ